MLCTLESRNFGLRSVGVCFAYPSFDKKVALAIMGIGDDAGIGRVGGDEVNGLALYQVKRARVSRVCPDLRYFILGIQRLVNKIQPVARHHDSIRVDIHTHGAPGACIPPELCLSPSSRVAPREGADTSTVAPVDVAHTYGSAIRGYRCAICPQGIRGFPLTVKHMLAGLCIAQNEVARDVWRPVAPVIPHVRGPVAAVGEGPDCGGFGGEGGGGKI